MGERIALAHPWQDEKVSRKPEQALFTGSIRIRESPMRNVFAVVVGASVAGALGSVTYQAVGIRCPFRMAGVACPGCGCGTAFRTFSNEGLGAAVRSEPTASLVLLALLVALISSAIVLSFSTSRQTARFWSAICWGFLAAASLANVIFQIRYQ